ncbi:hypothetical protein FPV67DRAFT_211896 [Lyophyllum atratum]|nr:hypothetical protein FPV67DRAFT_211896 [Lyophyllum atratum]
MHTALRSSRSHTGATVGRLSESSCSHSADFMIVIIEHGGFIRGFNTQISRLPNDNFGVSVLTNDNEYGKVIGEIIKNRIIDKALELEPIDWSSRSHVHSISCAVRRG